MLLNCGVGEDSWESLGLQGDPTSPSLKKLVLNIHWKDWCWRWNTNTLTTDVNNWLICKAPDAGKDWRQEENGMTEDEMVGWPHQLNGHEFEQTPGVGDGQVGLACCSPWGHKRQTQLSDWTELNVYINTVWLQKCFSFINKSPDCLQIKISSFLLDIS